MYDDMKSFFEEKQIKSYTEGESKEQWYTYQSWCNYAVPQVNSLSMDVVQHVRNNTLPKTPLTQTNWDALVPVRKDQYWKYLDPQYIAITKL
jgi:hypothetical protein